MSKNKLELFLGLILVVLPFLGFPIRYRSVIIVAVGVLLVAAALVSHMRRKSSLTNIYNE